MNIIEDEIIGELRYLTVEFDQVELLAGHIGVISQGAVRRYFEGKRPDLKVKKCGGLKLDSQRDIVTMRIGVVKKSTTVTIIDEFAGPDNDYSAAQKLLNPGYDELKAKYDEAANELKAVYDALPDTISGNTPLSKLVAELKDERDCLIKLGERRITRIDELKQSRNHIIDELDETNKQLLALQEKYDTLKQVKEELHDGYDRVVEGARKDDKEFGELKEKCDALVAAVMQDAQKFSDLLVENEELKTANIQQKEKYDALTKTKENIADLAESDKVSEKPDCDGGCNSCESHACDIDEAH
ncbi:hypothetical protein LCGC14_2235400 [marine sediment metagenome]|uniref:Uncharacterized protein n=1 Tax=marine sediment metagenome TaxID=412755 RepID=A0A0F9D6R9_9ZZZZ